MSELTVKAGSRPPWVGLSAAVWVQFAAGNSQTFPLYSPILKSVLGFNQQQITILGVAADIGENNGMLPGLACNKFPPWVVLAIGASLCFSGYGLIYLTATQTLPNVPYWLLWLALLFGANSSAWFSTTILVTNMRNFPLSRGTVAGLLKGYSGLSAAMYTEIFSMILNKSAPSLLLFLTFGLPVICSSMMYLIRLCSPASSEDSSQNNFLFTQAASILLGSYLLSTKVLDNTFSLEKSIRYTFVAIMVVLMMAPLTIPIKMTLYKKFNGGSMADPLLPKSSSESNLGGKLLEGEEEGGSKEGENADVDMLLAVGEGAVVKQKRKPHRGEDFTFGEALVKADFWLLWLVYFLGVGSGVTVLNNLGQISYAQGGNADTTMLLSLFSFCNFLGRLGGGAVSEHFVRSKAIPRTIWMTFTQSIMALSFLLYASDLSGTLYIATAMLGVSYGVQFTTMIPTASELFGLKNFGVIYNFILLGNPIGALLFSGMLAGSVYDAEAARQGVAMCLGAECFRPTFLVLSGICGLGAVLGVFLSFRIRPVYQMLYSSGSFKINRSSDH